MMEHTVHDFPYASLNRSSGILVTGQHLQAAWLTVRGPEVAAACRGCIRYGARVSALELDFSCACAVSVVDARLSSARG